MEANKMLKQKVRLGANCYTQLPQGFLIEPKLQKDVPVDFKNMLITCIMKKVLVIS